MSAGRKLEPLLDVSRLILEARLARVRQTAQACAENRRHLADLARPTVDSDLPLAVQAQTALGYERWAEARRAEINLVLARQTAEWLAARDEARHAFGRAEALQALRDRAGLPRR